MDFKILATTCFMVFFAELGDKTQLVTMGIAISSGAYWEVFLGAICGFILAAAIGVFLGTQIVGLFHTRTVEYFGGVFFIVVGVLTLWKPWST